ncbi:MAG: hypothetical protein ABIQ31_17905 [Ferruginibacter sp.]
MSFFKKLWGGVKKVGGFIAKIVTSKKTKAVVDAASTVVNNAQGTQLSEAEYLAYYQSQAANGSPPNTADKSASSSWLAFLSGENPLDLNKYITLPIVATTVKPVNWLVIAAIVGGAILLLKKKHR